MKLERLGEKFWGSQREFFYAPPTSVGTKKVEEIVVDEVHPSFQRVRLDFLEAGEGYLWISKVPADFEIKVGKPVEILVRMERGDIRMLPVRIAELFKRRAESWLVAIRPFDRTNYRSPANRDGANVQSMFLANCMDEESNLAFYERFLRTRTRTHPPIKLG